MFPHILNGRYSYYYLFFRLPGGLYQICCTLLSMSSKLFSKLKKKITVFYANAAFGSR